MIVLQHCTGDASPDALAAPVAHAEPAQHRARPRAPLQPAGASPARWRLSSPLAPSPLPVANARFAAGYRPDPGGNRRAPNISQRSGRRPYRAPAPSSPWRKSPLHSSGDASRLTALFVGCICPICARVTPYQAGASPLSVQRGASPRAARGDRPAPKHAAEATGYTGTQLPDSAEASFPINVSPARRRLLPPSIDRSSSSPCSACSASAFRSWSRRSRPTPSCPPSTSGWPGSWA